jgi:hypothetical protein
MHACKEWIMHICINRVSQQSKQVYVGWWTARTFSLRITWLLRAHMPRTVSCPPHDAPRPKKPCVDRITHVSTCVRTSVCVWIHTHMYEYIHICMNTYTYVWIYTCGNVHLCMLACMFGWMLRSMFICMYICVYTHAHMHTCIHVRMYLNIRKLFAHLFRPDMYDITYTYTYTYTYIYIYMCVCIYICIIYIYICIYIYVYIYMYIYIYAHTDTHLKKPGLLTCSDAPCDEEKTRRMTLCMTWRFAGDVSSSSRSIKYAAVCCRDAPTSVSFTLMRNKQANEAWCLHSTR